MHEVHAVLSGAVKQAVVRVWIGHNLAKLATAPSVENADVQPPQAEDATRLLSAAMAEDPELGPFLRLAVTLDARCGKLCALAQGHCYHARTELDRLGRTQKNGRSYCY